MNAAVDSQIVHHASERSSCRELVAPLCVAAAAASCARGESLRHGGGPHRNHRG